jgi:hypothetical protein
MNVICRGRAVTKAVVVAALTTAVVCTVAATATAAALRGTLYVHRAAAVGSSEPGASPQLANGGAARFRTIDFPGASQTFINGVTDAGELVGTYQTNAGAQGFIELGRHLTTFNYTGTTGVTFPSSINDQGTTVGSYTDPALSNHGWIRSADGDFSQLDDPTAASGPGLGTFAVAITDAGVVVGYYLDANDVAHGFIDSPGSGFTTVDAPGAGTGRGEGTNLNAINGAGVIVGTVIDANGVAHGLVDSHGSFFDFDAPDAGTVAPEGTTATGITRDGVVSAFTVFVASGMFENGGWLLSGLQFSPLDDPVAVTGTAPLGINQRGNEACGTYFDAAGNAHGFVAMP